MPAIKPDRVLGDLYKLRSFGTFKTGVHRPTYSVDDIASRAWFAEQCTAAGLETMTFNLGGEPISTILGFARPSAVDLIAMTTHGRTGLAKLLVGSVAQQVLEEAVLPTLLVRADAVGAAQCST